MTKKLDKEALCIYNKKYREINKEDISKKRAEYRKKNRLILCEKQKIYQRNNKEKVNAYRKNRRANDLNFKLSVSIRNRLTGSIRNNFKNGSFVRDLGCSIVELKIYIEEQFKEGMHWGNWGKASVGNLTWNIDHIKPLSSFDLKNRDQFLQACHFTNLQPMWAIDNIKKGGKNKKLFPPTI